MGDVLKIVLGRRHCGWCSRNIEPTWWERFTGGDKKKGEAARWQEVYWTASFWLDVHVPVYRIAERWHYRFHKDNDAGC